MRTILVAALLLLAFLAIPLASAKPLPPGGPGGVCPPFHASWKGAPIVVADIGTCHYVCIGTSPQLGGEPGWWDGNCVGWSPIPL
jgi:hypothetical protein